MNNFRYVNNMALVKKISFKNNNTFQNKNFSYVNDMALVINNFLCVNNMALEKKISYNIIILLLKTKTSLMWIIWL